MTLDKFKEMFLKNYEKHGCFETAKEATRDDFVLYLRTDEGIRAKAESPHFKVDNDELADLVIKSVSRTWIGEEPDVPSFTE